jgi:hypothetical protein
MSGKRALTAKAGNTLAKLAVEKTGEVFTVDCWLQVLIRDGRGKTTAVQLRSIPGIACVAGVTADSDGGSICRVILERPEGDPKADGLDMTALLDWLSERDDRFEAFRAVKLSLEKAAGLYDRPGALTVLR